MPVDDLRSPRSTVMNPERRPEFTLHAERGEESAILYLGGELDALVAPRLAACLDDLVLDGSGELTVNARKLEFIDSTGLFVLLNAQRRLTRRGRRLRLICAPGAVRRAIELSRLTETFGLVGD